MAEKVIVRRDGVEVEELVYEPPSLFMQIIYWIGRVLVGAGLIFFLFFGAPDEMRKILTWESGVGVVKSVKREWISGRGAHWEYTPTLISAEDRWGNSILFNQTRSSRAEVKPGQVIDILYDGQRSVEGSSFRSGVYGSRWDHIGDLLMVSALLVFLLAMVNAPLLGKLMVKRINRKRWERAMRAAGVASPKRVVAGRTK
ncbi:DUF3592 domain-containing protein [Magnetofaba australis]|nr:hypothetical protein [Magnetofaba australis]